MLPSGNLFQFALENGPVEPVDLPIFSRLVDLSSSFFVNVYQPGISWDCFYHDQLGVCTTSDHIIRTCPSHAEVLLVFSKLALEK
jgi:hypothetical protein